MVYQLRRIKPRRPSFERHVPSFSVLDEMAASTTKPLSRAYYDWRVDNARESLRLMTMAYGGRDQWLTLAGICHVLEVLVELGHARDPNGLVQECESILVAMVDECSATDGQGLLSVGHVGRFHLACMIEDFAECIAAAPARTMIHVMRITERRQHEANLAKQRLQEAAS